MNHFGFKKRGRSVKKKSTNKDQTTATTRKSPGQICVSPAEKAAIQHKKGPEPHQKSPHQNHQDCLRHDRDKPAVSPNCTKRISKSMAQTKRGWKAVQLWRTATKLLEATVHYGSHLRVLSGVLCLSSNRLVSFKGSGSCHKTWVNSP